MKFAEYAVASYKASTSFDAGNSKSASINQQVVQLVRAGFATHGIATKLGITAAQVTHRVSMYGLQGIRAKYRNMETVEAKEQSTAVTAWPMSSTSVTKCQRIRDRVLKMKRNATNNNVTA